MRKIIVQQLIAFERYDLTDLAKSMHPQAVLLAQFSLYVHKGGLKPDSFHFISLAKSMQPKYGLII